MVHVNYHVVESDQPIECAHQIGRLFGPIMRGYVEEGRASEGWRQRKRDAEELLGATRRWFPEYVKELEAYSAGARIPLIDVWTVSIEDELDDEGGDERCTTIVTNSGRLLAHNEDWDAEAVDAICVLKKVIGNTTSLELYYYGCPLGGTAITVNSRGYVQAINSIDHADWRVGVPKIVLARRLSELRNGYAELPGLLEIPRSSGFAHTLLDRKGHLIAVECTATRQTMSAPQLPFVHTNHCLNEAVARCESKSLNRSTFLRFASAIGGTRRAMSAGDLMTLMSDGGVHKSSTLLNENTIARAIVDIEAAVMRIWLRRENAMGWVDYPISFMTAAADNIA